MLDCYKHQSLRMDYVRLGYSKHWDMEKRRHAWSQITVPRVAPPQIYKNVDPKRYLNNYEQVAPAGTSIDPNIDLHEPRNWHDMWRGLGAGENQLARGVRHGRDNVAAHRTRKMINFLAPRGLRLNTVLGWGGLGVATLWEKHQKQADGAPGDERTFFVVKANLDPSSKSLNAEIIAQRWYADCMHMAQTVESPAPDLLVMEYERGGNLKDAMCR